MSTSRKWCSARFCALNTIQSGLALCSKQAIKLLHVNATNGTIIKSKLGDLNSKLQDSSNEFVDNNADNRQHKESDNVTIFSEKSDVFLIDQPAVIG